MARAAIIIVLAILIALPGAWSLLAAPDVDPSVLREAVAPPLPTLPVGLSPSPSATPSAQPAASPTMR